MKLLTLNELVQKINEIPDDDCFVIIIEDDLSEGFYKKSWIKNNLEDNINISMGYCFNTGDNNNFFWKYNPDNKKFEVIKKEGKYPIFPHDKIKLKSDFSDKIKF